MSSLHASLDDLCKGGEANLGISDIEYSVVVGHEGITQDPEGAADGRVRDNAANAVTGTLRDLTEVQALCHGEGLATEGEGDGGESGIARECVKACADSGGSILRTRDLLIE